MYSHHKVRVTKEFSFEMAHALEGHDGKCRNIHGHSYHLSVTIIGTPIHNLNNPKNGMVMDFGDLKGIVERVVIEPLDHSLVLFEESEFKRGIKNCSGQLVVFKPYNPTCENLIIDFARQIRSALPGGAQLHSLKLRETQTGYAEWHASDNVT